MPTILDRSVIASFSSLELLAKEIVQGFITGLHKSPFHGFSVEFAEHRQYNTGESTRHIDWKLFGRTERLFVKQYEEETNLRCNFLLDVSPSMYYPREGEQLSKLEYAAYGIAVLVELLQRQRDAFSLSAFDEELLLETEMKSTAQHQEFVYDKLSSLIIQPAKKTGNTNLVPVLHQKAETLPQRSMVVLFTDFLSRDEPNEALWDAFRHLTYKKHDVVIFHVYDSKTELNLDFGKRQVKFVDAETGDVVKLNPEGLKALYSERIQEQFTAVERELLQMKMDFCALDIAQPFDAMMRFFLARRKKMLQKRR